MAKLSYEDILRRGISATAARKICAAICMAKEIAEPSTTYEERITSASTAIAYCKAEFVVLANHGKKEEVHVVSLNTKHSVIAHHVVTVGTLCNSLLHPREVFRPAILDSAKCILLVHNHPSGDCTPSEEDIAVTKRIREAGKIVGIPLLDHVILGRGCACTVNDGTWT